MLSIIPKWESELIFNISYSQPLIKNFHGRLAFFLTDLTTTPDKAREVIKILIEELEKWVTKARNGDNENEKEIDTVKENMLYSEGSVKEINGDYNNMILI